MRTRLFLSPSNNQLVGAYPADAEHIHIVCDTTDAEFTVQLPDANLPEHKELIFYNVPTSGTGHNVHVIPVGGQTLANSAVEHILAPGDTVTFVGDLKNRWLLSDINATPGAPAEINHALLNNLNSVGYSHLSASQKNGLVLGNTTSLHKHDHAAQFNLNSANYSHLTANQKNDLTDGGQTTLHKHDHALQNNLNSTNYSHLTAYEKAQALAIVSSQIVPITTYAQLAEYVTLTGSSQGYVIIAGDIILPGDYTIPANIEVIEIVDAGRFSGPHTITILSMSADPLHQIIAAETTLAGVSVVRPEWFGCDGTNDDVAINKASLSLPVKTDSVLATTYYGRPYVQGTVKLRPTTYKTSARVQVGNPNYWCDGVIFEGNGAVIDSTSTDDIMRFGDPDTSTVNAKVFTQCRISDITLASQTAKTGLRLVGKYSCNRFENISIMTENSTRFDLKQAISTTTVYDGSYYNSWSRIQIYYWDIGFALGADFANLTFRNITDVDTDTDTITHDGDEFNENDIVWIRCVDGNLPSGLSVQPKRYHVINASGTSFQVSTTSGGAAVALVTEGDGTLQVCEWPGAWDGGPAGSYTQNANMVRGVSFNGVASFGMFFGGSVQSYYRDLVFFGGGTQSQIGLLGMAVSDLANSEFVSNEPFSSTPTAHGMSTGDRAIIRKEINVAKPLDHERTYFVIKTGDTKFKLALTYADAISGTFVTITEAQTERSWIKLDRYYNCDIFCAYGTSSNTFESQNESNFSDSYYFEEDSTGNKVLWHNAFNGGTVVDRNSTVRQNSTMYADGGIVHRVQAIDAAEIRASEKAGFGSLKSPRLPNGRIIATWDDDGFHMASPSSEEAIEIPKYEVLTVSDVNTTTDVITTASANVLQSGEEVKFITDGTLPSPLTEEGRYYWNVVDTTHGRLYTTPALAIAGSAAGLIDLTTTGSGTITVEKTCLFVYWGNKFVTSSENSAEFNVETIIGNPNADRQKITLFGVGGNDGSGLAGKTVILNGLADIKLNGAGWADYKYQNIELEKDEDSVWVETSRQDSLGTVMGVERNEASETRWAYAGKGLGVGTQGRYPGDGILLVEEEAEIRGTTDITAGIIDAISVAVAGTGYAMGDLLTLDGGSDSTVSVQSVDEDGAVLTAFLISGGSGYSTGVSTTTVSPVGGTGCTINVTAVKTGAALSSFGGLVVAKKVAVLDNTDTSSGSTGSIHTLGGIGATKDIYSTAKVTGTTGGLFGSASHNTTFQSSGHQVMAGDARPWRDQLADALSLQQSGSGVSVNGADGTVEFTAAAAYNATFSLADALFTNVQLNHDKDLTASIYPHIHWFQAKNYSPNFLLEYRWQINGGAKVTAWTQLACNTLAHTYVSGTIHQISYSAAIAVPVGTTLSDIVQFRVYRDTGGASTTFSGQTCPYNTGGNAVVGLIAFDVHFMVNSVGSTDEYTK